MICAIMWANSWNVIKVKMARRRSRAAEVENSTLILQGMIGGVSDGQKAHL
jgi:hypothetical protein